MIGEPASSAPQVRRGRGLPGVRAQRLQVGGEHGVGAQQRLDAHRGGDVGGGEQQPQVVRGQHEHAEHAVGAVDQREALLLGAAHRRDAGGGECVGRGRELARRVAHLALAHQRQRAVRERREVAGAAERAVLAHDRGDARR